MFKKILQKIVLLSQQTRSKFEFDSKVVTKVKALLNTKYFMPVQHSTIFIQTILLRNFLPINNKWTIRPLM